jgi:hypothetical protein
LRSRGSRSPIGRSEKLSPPLSPTGRISSTAFPASSDSKYSCPQGGDWVLATWWDSRDDLRRWLRSDEHERTHRRAPAELGPYLRSARVEVFEVQT